MQLLLNYISYIFDFKVHIIMTSCNLIIEYFRKIEDLTKFDRAKLKKDRKIVIYRYTNNVILPSKSHHDES